MLGCGNVSLISSSAELACTQEYEWVSASLQTAFSSQETDSFTAFRDIFVVRVRKLSEHSKKRRLKVGVCPGPVAKHVWL